MKKNSKFFIFFVLMCLILCPAFSSSPKEKVNVKEDLHNALINYYSSEIPLIENLYDKFLAITKVYNSHSHSKVEIDPNLISYLGLSIDDVSYDLSWIKKMVLDINSNVIANEYSVEFKIIINDIEILKGYLYFNYTEDVYAFYIPNISDKYYKIDLKDQDELFKKLGAYFLSYRDLPSKEEFGKFILSFVDLAMDYIGDVDKVEQITISGLSGVIFNKYTFTVSAEDFSTIIKEFILKFINDYFGKTLLDNSDANIEAELNSYFKPENFEDLKITLWFDKSGDLCREEIYTNNQLIASTDKTNGRDYTSFFNYNNASSLINGTITNNNTYNLTGNITSKYESGISHIEFDAKNLTIMKDLGLIKSGDIDYDFIFTSEQNVTNSSKFHIGINSANLDNGKLDFSINALNSNLDLSVDYSKISTKYDYSFVFSYNNESYQLKGSTTVDDRSKITHVKFPILSIESLSDNLNYLGILSLANALNKAGFNIADITQLFK